MTKKQAKIILAFAENSMKIRPAAKQLYMSDCNVSYHLKQVWLQTGRDPMKFFDLCYLVGVALQILDGDKQL